MRLKTEYENDVAEALGRPDPAETPMVTETDVAHLPEAVSRYLDFAGVIGRPRVRSYRLRFSGQFRMSAERPWMRMRAQQVSFADPPARHFLIQARLVGVPFSAYHRYVGSEATFRVKVASLATVVDAKGPEMTQGETVTLLNDMCLLAPATLIDPTLEWRELGPREVRVTFSNAGHTVSATLYFDEEGALRDFVSDDRTATEDGKTYRSMRWSTPVYEWRVVNGVMLPVNAEAMWHEEDGKTLPYARFEHVEAEYNVAPAVPDSG